jgi:4-aminobutyrate aminotransferase-like enzyme
LSDDHELLARRNRAMGQGAPAFYELPVHLVRGEGIWLFDAAGRRFMDVYNNVPAVGHCHPRIVEALQRQASTLNVHSRYLSEVVVSYCERLRALHADPLSSLLMGCSGTEALEIALQLARVATGGQGIIISNATYHGNSTEVRRTTFGPFEPDYRRIHFPDAYRPPREGASEAERLGLHLDEIRDAIAGFEADGIPLAGMLFCSIFANEGLPDVPEGFLAEAAALVREAGGVVILDEVQAGFGRTGRWWGYDAVGCEPDLVTMGKPMGAGFPLSGVGTSAELAKTFHEKCFYFNTTAGTPLQAAVGHAVLDVIEDEGLVENAAKVGGFLESELSKLVDRYEFVGDVRGMGLFLGIEWVESSESRKPDRQGAAAFVERMKQKGFLMGSAGQRNNVLKIRPPLVMERSHAELLLAALEETTQELHAEA